MIEISFGKLVLFALIALIVLGPEKLPGAARTVGALLRRVRSGWDDVRAEVERELQIEEIKRAAREAATRAEAAQVELDATVQKVRDVQHVVQHEVQNIGQPLNHAVPGDPPVAAIGSAVAASDETHTVEPDTATGDLFAGMTGPALKAPLESPHGHA